MRYSEYYVWDVGIHLIYICISYKSVSLLLGLLVLLILLVQEKREKRVFKRYLITRNSSCACRRCLVAMASIYSRGWWQNTCFVQKSWGSMSYIFSSYSGYARFAREVLVSGEYGIIPRMCKKKKTKILTHSSLSHTKTPTELVEYLMVSSDVSFSTCNKFRLRVTARPDVDPK